MSRGHDVKEAEKLWCPFARVADRYAFTSHSQRDTLTPPVINRTYGPSPFPLGAVCLGPACMAWRWIEPPPHAFDEAPAFGYRERGYCGLAGEP